MLKSEWLRQIDARWPNNAVPGQVVIREVTTWLNHGPRGIMALVFPTSA